jgi:hypothetical protein
MTIAGGLALIIIGAILRWAVTWQNTWIDLATLGLILMIGGAVGLVAGVIVTWARQRARRQSTVYEQRYYKEPPPPV